MSIVLDKKQCLIAGDGELPVAMAESAQKNGFEVVAISLSSDNRNKLKKYCSKVYNFGPGEVTKIKQTLVDEKITQVTFIGKVHKGLLLRRPKLDMEAIRLMKEAQRLNDDAVMLIIVEQLENMGICVLDQTIFIKNCMIPSGVLGKVQPTEAQKEDVDYGFYMAKEMGRLDVGQSVVIKDKMVMAVEAIEGTDRCIERGAKIAKNGASIIKVAKPSQDNRFDIPAIGLNTLRVMKKYKASLIALEADKTIIVNQKEVVDFADKNNIVIMAV